MSTEFAVDQIVDQEGLRAKVIGVSKDEASLIVACEKGRFQIPLKELHEEGDHLAYAGRIDDLSRLAEVETVIPVIEERVSVGKRQHVTGRVKIRKTVASRTERVPLSTTKETVHIRRLPRDELLAQPAVTRSEGDVTFIPVQEEVYVIEKRYRLTEEIRIERRVETTVESREIELRYERVEVLKEGPDPN